VVPGERVLPAESAWEVRVSERRGNGEDPSAQEWSATDEATGNEAEGTAPAGEDGFAPAYGVQLFFREEPQLDKRAVYEGIRRHCPAVEPLDGSLDSSLLAFLHPDHPVELADGTMPAQTFVAATEGAFDKPALGEALEQSWRFEAAREVVAECRHSVVVTDLMSASLPYRQRLELFQAALAGVLETLGGAAIHWVPTQQVITPELFLDGYAQGGPQRFFAGAVNVRMFNIEGTPHRVMDTVGLAAIGLPDVQCHFHGLSPSAVANVLYDVAHYLYDHGPVIDHGDTVGGIEPGDRWRCRHEWALIEPRRMVIDLDPGPDFAAGTRSEPEDVG
jgi:hypothetical protein